MLRNKTYSGIDFHDRSLSFATIKLERGLPVLQNVFKQEVDENLLAGGRLAQMDTVESSLEDAVKNGKLTKQVHLAIPTQSILIRKITSLPDIAEPELAKLLQFQVGESIHLPFENPIYDFVKIGSIGPKTLDPKIGLEEEEELSLDDLAKGIEENIEGPKSEVLLFATSQSLSKDLMDVCTDAALKPLTAEIRALALQRLLSYVHPHWLKETDMIIDVSEDSVDIHIFKDGIVVFSRMMSINQIDYLLAPDNKQESEFLLLDEDFSLEAQSEAAAAKEGSNNVSDESYVEQLILEIERAQNFFHYSLNERNSQFKRFIVTGEFADRIYKPLKARFDAEEVVRIDYSSILAENFGDHDQLDSCSVAIGLAMRAHEKSKKK
ncbi:type IV pilus biogenesis protein PilM [Bacillus dakarensis]|uniref:type IV pilus biogenesis protein PilM n=1 Tax=Robertmurraya dakarensis TaxID=1926278 RepID=UPI0009808E47|nr:hypothetical protein [Bacillus dakarensis]